MGSGSAEEWWTLLPSAVTWSCQMGLCRESVLWNWGWRWSEWPRRDGEAKAHGCSAGGCCSGCARSPHQ